ncbi:unnamed protein product, partial [Owenia fusiformis]
TFDDNPYSLPFDVWKGMTRFFISVINNGTLLDTLTFNLIKNNTYASGDSGISEISRILQGTLTNQTSLTLIAWPICNPDYYSGNCSVYCKVQDTCDGHYTCEVNTGNVVCSANWAGDTCTERPIGYSECPMKYDDAIIPGSGFLGTWVGSFDCNSVEYSTRMDISDLGALGTQPKGVLKFWNTEAMVNGSQEIMGTLSMQGSFTLIGLQWINKPDDQTVLFVLGDGKFDDAEQTISLEFKALGFCTSEITTLYRPKNTTKECQNGGVCVRNGTGE